MVRNLRSKIGGAFTTEVGNLSPHKLFGRLGVGAVKGSHFLEEGLAAGVAEARARLRALFGAELAKIISKNISGLSSTHNRFRPTAGINFSVSENVSELGKIDVSKLIFSAFKSSVATAKIVSDKAFNDRELGKSELSIALNHEPGSNPDRWQPTIDSYTFIPFSNGNLIGMTVKYDGGPGSDHAGKVRALNFGLRATKKVGA